MIRIGYASLNWELPSPSRTFRLKNYTEEKMLEYTKNNLEALMVILSWNKQNDIKVFRITSDLVPFGSAKINSGSWKEALKKEFAEVGTFIKENKMKVSMHPGQYTVLNAQNSSYYANALADLTYHNDVLDLMGLENKHRIILHGGGAYGDKIKSKKVLIERTLELPKKIKDRLTLENDEKVFNAEDIFEISLRTNTPATFDCFHHSILPSFDGQSDRQIIQNFAKTWPRQERPEIHYSNQHPQKIKGTHSETIEIDKFRHFYEKVKDLEIDIILEVKDKERSVLKIRKEFPEIK